MENRKIKIDNSFNDWISNKIKIDGEYCRNEPGNKCYFIVSSEVNKEAAKCTLSKFTLKHVETKTREFLGHLRLRECVKFFSEEKK